MFTAETRPPVTDPPVIYVLKSGNRYLYKTLGMNKYNLLTTYQSIAMTINHAWSTSTSRVLVLRIAKPLVTTS